MVEKMCVLPSCGVVSSGERFNKEREYVSNTYRELKGWRVGEEGRLLDRLSRERTRMSKNGQKSIGPNPKVQREGRERE